MYALDLYANVCLYFSFFCYRFVSLTWSIWQSFHSQNNNSINTNLSSLPLKFIGVISRRKPLYMIINLFSLEVRNVKNSPGHGMWNLRRLCSAGTIYVHIKQIPVGKPLIQFIPANSFLFLFLFHYQVYRKTFHNWYVRTVYRKVSERRREKHCISFSLLCF